MIITVLAKLEPFSDNGASLAYIVLLYRAMAQMLFILLTTVQSRRSVVIGLAVFVGIID